VLKMIFLSVRTCMRDPRRLAHCYKTRDQDREMPPTGVRDQTLIAGVVNRTTMEDSLVMVMKSAAHLVVNPKGAA
jgi:hypothetical protein